MKKYFSSICIITIILIWEYAAAKVVGGNRIMDQAMDDNLCALTFDDGPSRNTPQLLDMLAAYNIKATFFLLGSQVFRCPELAQRIADEGHEIGNHSWSHPNLRTLSRERQHEELSRTDGLLRSMGIVPVYIRPPYGSFDERTVAIADELGADIILWSLDSHDWKRLPSDYAKLLSTRGTIYEDGALRGIFLFHDTHKSTVDDLPRIMAHLKAGGCDRFVTVSEYLAGILDPEPALLMSRHTEPRLPRPDLPVLAAGPVTAPAAAPPSYAAGTGAVPMARCSRPFAYQAEQKAEQLDLEDAHASAPPRSGGL